MPKQKKPEVRRAPPRPDPPSPENGSRRPAGDPGPAEVGSALAQSAAVTAREAGRQGRLSGRAAPRPNRVTVTLSPEALDALAQGTARWDSDKSAVVGAALGFWRSRNFGEGFDAQTVSKIAGLAVELGLRHGEVIEIAIERWYALVFPDAPTPERLLGVSLKPLADHELARLARELNKTPEEILAMPALEVRATLIALDAPPPKKRRRFRRK